MNASSIKLAIIIGIITVLCILFIWVVSQSLIISLVSASGLAVLALLAFTLITYEEELDENIVIKNNTIYDFSVSEGIEDYYSDKITGEN